MKEHVMLFEDFQESLNEAKVKPFLSLAMDKVEARKQLKKGKSYWLKKDTWSSWKKFKLIQFLEYDFDYGLKIFIDGMPKPETLMTKDFGLYQLSNVDPTEHEGQFDKKGNPIKVSKKGIWSMKTLKKEIKSMRLKDYDESESMDMLMDFINNNDGTLDWINKKSGEDYDTIDAADWLYNQFS